MVTTERVERSIRGAIDAQPGLRLVAGVRMGDPAKGGGCNVLNAVLPEVDRAGDYMLSLLRAAVALDVEPVDAQAILYGWDDVPAHRQRAGMDERYVGIGRRLRAAYRPEQIYRAELRRMMANLEVA